MTPFGDLGGVLDSSREMAQGLDHLLLGFEKELIRGELEPSGVMDGFAGLDAEEDVMGANVLAVQIIGNVVGSDDLGWRAAGSCPEFPG